MGAQPSIQTEVTITERKEKKKNKKTSTTSTSDTNTHSGAMQPSSDLEFIPQCLLKGSDGIQPVLGDVLMQFVVRRDKHQPVHSLQSRLQSSGFLIIHCTNSSNNETTNRNKKSQTHPVRHRTHTKKQKT